MQLILIPKADDRVIIHNDPNNTRGTAVGLSSIPAQFFSDYIEISSDDEVILFTDGIIEAMNDQHEEFGYARFQNAIQKNINKNLKEQISSAINELIDFTGKDQFEDDITILILRRK